MLKIALAAGIAVEWITGPIVDSLSSIAVSGLRALTFGLLIWLVLEALALVWKAVGSLEG